MPGSGTFLSPGLYRFDTRCKLLCSCWLMSPRRFSETLPVSCLPLYSQLYPLASLSHTIIVRGANGCLARCSVSLTFIILKIISCHG